MGKFCTKCGRPLAEGEVCTCQQQNAQTQNTYNGQAMYNNQDMNYNQNMYQGQNMNNGYQNWQQSAPQGGNAQNAGSAFTEQAQNFAAGFFTDDSVPLKKLIGIGESEKNDITDCFERNKLITPDMVAPCEQEIHVKQYDICNARSRIRGLWQEGRIQVTNKRVLFRLSGRSWIGKTMSHVEFTIDEIAGISISNGVRFALVDFFISFLVAMLVMALFGKIGASVGFLGFLIGIAGYVPCFIFKKKYGIKAMAMAASVGGFFGAVFAWFTKWPMYFALISFIVLLVLLFLFSLKPSLSISVMTKCASDSPIHIWSRQTMVSIMEILPGKDADQAIEELGAMIQDIQKFGDLGLEKWKD